MKKFNHANIGLFALFTALLCLSSCSSDDDNYPKEYVGFEHSITKVNCDKNEAEKEIQIKIIAVKKSKEDRTVALTPPPDRPRTLIFAVGWHSCSGFEVVETIWWNLFFN